MIGLNPGLGSLYSFHSLIGTLGCMFYLAHISDWKEENPSL